MPSKFCLILGCCERCAFVCSVNRLNGIKLVYSKFNSPFKKNSSFKSAQNSDKPPLIRSCDSQSKNIPLIEMDFWGSKSEQCLATVLQLNVCTMYTVHCTVSTIQKQPNPGTTLLLESLHFKVYIVKLFSNATASNGDSPWADEEQHVPINQRQTFVDHPPADL